MFVSLFLYTDILAYRTLFIFAHSLPFSLPLPFHLSGVFLFYHSFPLFLSQIPLFMFFFLNGFRMCPYFSVYVWFADGWPRVKGLKPFMLSTGADWTTGTVSYTMVSSSTGTTVNYCICGGGLWWR
jgi:hypothetical protein